MTCRKCGLPRGGGNHQTLAECERWLVLEGRRCQNPEEHHPFRRDWRRYFAGIYWAIRGEPWMAP